ncbi:hypothetical protein [Fodinicola feengrottensis]|uniref:hypothetical protein n=1 Tax=Fodinicola feengrottensis TaxID=435914 RepID=UPI0013D5C895|nr:hypothetical protein [Fodinicola feengrottensis]
MASTTATLTLRFADQPVPLRVFWPPIGEKGIVVVFDERADEAQRWCRSLCADANLVVLTDAADLPTALSIVEWTADHATELGSGDVRPAARSHWPAGVAARRSPVPCWPRRAPRAGRR